MSKYIYGIIVAAAIIFGVFYLTDMYRPPVEKKADIGQKTAQNNIENEDVLSDEGEVRPWIEVLSDSVRMQTADGWQDLQTGDQVENGAIISSDVNGLANIHMPDGSSIQLDSNSEITLEQADYADESDSLKVKIRLTAGRVWSKIIELATTDSYWEVETSNAVASVRGTAFGMEYGDDETQVIGSENTVEVEAWDSATGETLGRTPVVARKILAIKKQTLLDLRARRADLAGEVREAGEDIQSRPWVKRAVVADQLLNRKIEALRERGMENIEIKRTIRRELLERRLQILMKLRQSGVLPRLLKPLLIQNINSTSTRSLLPASDNMASTSATATPINTVVTPVLKTVTNTVTAPTNLK